VARSAAILSVAMEYMIGSAKPFYKSPRDHKD